MNFSEVKHMPIEFFMTMIPPTVTHQEHKVAVVNGKPVFYDTPELHDARMKLTAHLSKHKPKTKYNTAVRLVSKWCWPTDGKHKDGEWKTTKPDTDNMIKLLKDCMTAVGFWKDDALVTSDITEKFWADIPGIYVRIEEL